jgi:hypothetical protein
MRPWEIQDLTEKLWFKCLFWTMFILSILNFSYSALYATYFNVNIDFSVYYLWANHLKAGYPFLLNVQNAAHPSFYYPPFWGLLMMPFTWLPYHTAKTIWYGFNLIQLGILGWIFRQWFLQNLHDQQYWYRWGFVILASSFTPLIESLRHGQANLLILFLLCLCLWFHEKKNPITAGIFLGLAIMIKILPLVFIAYWFWKKQWKLMYSAILSTLFLGMISILALGWKSHLYFFQDNKLYVAYTKLHWLHQGNISIYSFLKEGQFEGYFPVIVPMYGLALVIAAGVAGLLLIVYSRGSSDMRRTAQEYTLGITSLFLASTYIEHHQFLLVLLAYAIAWRYLDHQQTPAVLSLFLLSWLLMLAGFQMDDLDFNPFRNFLGMYFHTYGIIALWLGLYLWLRQYAKPLKSIPVS